MCVCQLEVTGDLLLLKVYRGQKIWQSIQNFLSLQVKMQRNKFVGAEFDVCVREDGLLTDVSSNKRTLQPHLSSNGDSSFNF